MAKNIVREEDEDMLSDGLATVDKEEEEKTDKHNQPYQSVIPPPNSKIMDKLHRKKFDFLYHRTAFRFMGDFYKQMFI